MKKLNSKWKKNAFKSISNTMELIQYIDFDLNWRKSMIDIHAKGENNREMPMWLILILSHHSIRVWRFKSQNMFHFFLFVYSFQRSFFGLELVSNIQCTTITTIDDHDVWCHSNNRLCLSSISFSISYETCTLNIVYQIYRGRLINK